MKNNKSNKSLIIILCITIPLALILLLMILSVFVAIIFMRTGKEVKDLGDYTTRKYGFSRDVYTSYKEYSKYFNDKTEEDFEKYDYYVFDVNYSPCGERNLKVEDVYEKYGKLNISVKYTKICNEYCELNYKYISVRLPKNKYYVNDINLMIEQRNKIECHEIYEDKPMIYLYPEEDTNVRVTLGYPEKLTVSYPKYNNGWNVLAKKDGTLLSNNRQYYGLYWEGVKSSKLDMSKGFVVKGEDTVKFLEGKLSLLGLNEREANEFIVYWLPKMENNKYNFIRFSTREEIDNYMPIQVTPEPDTIIRIYMEFKPINDILNVEEQELKQMNRKGFTVVEWGGTMYE